MAPNDGDSADRSIPPPKLLSQFGRRLVRPLITGVRRQSEHMEPDQIPTLITAFVGAVAGGTFAAIGFLYRQSAASKREYRRLLFELVGIYHALSTARLVTPTTYVEAYFSVLSDMGYPEPKDQQALRELLVSLVAPQIEQLLHVMHEWSEESYTNRIEQIAELQPILAHSLKANVLLKFVLKASSAALNTSLSHLEKVGVDAKDAEPAAMTAQQWMWDSILRDLKSDIMRIARFCGPVEFFRTYRWLNRPDASIEERIRPFVSEMVHVMETRIDTT